MASPVGARGDRLVVFTALGPSGASGRVRVRQWLDHTGVVADIHDHAGLPNNRPKTVARHSTTVFAAEARTRGFARKALRRVLISREVTPFSSGGLIERIAAGSEMSVYDFDDALMWVPDSRLERLWSKSRNCLRAVRAVDRVIAGSEVLAEWAAMRNSDVRLIPSCVEPTEYEVKSEFEWPDRPRLVWLGSASTEKYLGAVAGALLEVHRATSARLTVISSGSASLGPLDAMVDRVQWTPGIERRLSDYDVGVAPLTDGSWERGKCAYKVLQYGAAGLPSVVSPVGANLTAAKALGFGVAREDHEWVDTLMDLLREATAPQRRRQGLAAREAVVQKYSFDAWADMWLDAVGEGAAPHTAPAT